MSIAGKVNIVEVGPRDGLQNEKQVLDAKTKIALVHGLIDAGLKTIEAGSFVSPRWVPQMANTDQVLTGIGAHDGVIFPVLVPNRSGLTRVQDYNHSAVQGKNKLLVNEVSCFTSVSETFNQKNINCSIDESLVRIRDLVAEASAAGMRIRAYVSCVGGCPYEGAIEIEKVVYVAEKLFEMGCYEISLGDTIGTASPVLIEKVLTALTPSVAVNHLALHLHDTYGQALANIYRGLELGVRVFDSSVSGLGGCPYAKGASGNVATEDLIYLLNGLGLEHGVDLDRLVQVGNDISHVLQRTNGSKVARALLAK